MYDAGEHGVFVEVGELRAHRIGLGLVGLLHQLGVLLPRSRQLIVEIRRVFLEVRIVFE